MNLHNNRAPCVRIPVYNWCHARIINKMFTEAGATWACFDSFRERCATAEQYNWCDDEHHCTFTAWSMADGTTSYILSTHIPESWLADRTCLNKHQLKRWLGLQVNELGDTIPVTKHYLAVVPTQVSSSTHNLKLNFFGKLLATGKRISALFKSLLNYLRNTSAI